MKRKFRKLYRKRTYVQWAKAAAAPFVRLFKIPAFQFWIVTNAAAPVLVRYTYPLFDLDIYDRMLIYWTLVGCIAGANVWGAYKFSKARIWFVYTILLNAFCPFSFGTITVATAIFDLPFTAWYLFWTLHH